MPHFPHVLLQGFSNYYYSVTSIPSIENKQFLGDSFHELCIILRTDPKPYPRSCKVAGFRLLNDPSNVEDEVAFSSGYGTV
jgi:hypothetical protein